MHSGHRKRMKERFLNDNGFENFAQHEILEMLLYSTIPRSDTNPLGHALMERFGSIANVFDASPEELKEVSGIGESSAFLLSLIPHLTRVYTQAKWDKRQSLCSTELAGQFAVNLFVGKAHEEFWMICVDSNRRVFYQGCIAKGTINEVPAYPRLVVQEVLKHNVQNVIFTHNHPGGSIRPSEADLVATEALLSAMMAINVDVIDHIIVSGNSFYSMAEHDFR